MSNLRSYLTKLYQFTQQKTSSVRFSERGRLLVFFGIALAVTLAISNNGAVAEVLSQSPVSPAAQPEPVQQPPAQQPPAPQPVPVQPQEDAAQPEPANPIEEPLIDPLTGQPIRTGNQPVEPVSPVIPEASGPSIPQPENGAEPLEPPPFPEPEQRSERLDPFEETEDLEDEGSSNFVLDQVELIDSVVVGVAWVWLCCGAGLFLLIPIVFLFLQIRGRTKILREENL